MLDSDNCTVLGDFNNDNFALEFCNSTEIKSICLNACQLLACDELKLDSRSSIDIFYDVSVKILTFLLLAGFAATVDTKLFFETFKDKGVYIGLICQFFMMPALGFLTILLFNKELDLFLAIMIILVTSSPGGAYSNWLCSMFNADLSLSVAMTTTSTFFAIMMLPLNVFIYLQLYIVVLQSSEDDATDVVTAIPYKDLFFTLSTVLCGVITGLMYGYCVTQKYQRLANIIGNISGVLLQLLSLFASSTSCAPPWEQSIFVYICTFIPLAGGIGLTFLITSRFTLPKPQRVAICIEAGYQNIGIAAAVALSLGSKGRSAVVVSILYGTFQAICFTAFCLTSVYYGWSLTPPKTRLLKLLFDDFQHLIAVHKHYEGWRKKHPHATDQYTEEELREMRQLLLYEESFEEIKVDETETESSDKIVRL